MTSTHKLINRIVLVFANLLAPFYLLLPPAVEAQSTSVGYEVNACILNAVDAYNDVEETVCLSGDSTELDAEAAVDSWAYEDLANWPNGDGYVNDLSAEVIVGVLDSGVQSSPPTAHEYFTPTLNTTYIAEGYYGEYYDSTGTFCGGGCSWLGPYDSGLWGEVVVVAPATPTVSIASPTCGGSGSSTLVATLSDTGYLPNGSVSFYYDSTNYLGAAYVDGHIATLGSVSGPSGTHTFKAVYSGDQFSGNPYNPGGYEENLGATSANCQLTY